MNFFRKIFVAVALLGASSKWISLPSASAELVECTASDVGDSNCVTPPQAQMPGDVELELTEEDQDVADEDEDDNQISSELDGLIRLQQLKLEHLMRSQKKGKKKGKKKGGVAAEAPPPPAQQQRHRPAFQDHHDQLSLHSYLVPRMHLQTNYTIAFHHVMQVRAMSPQEQKRKASPPRDVVVVLVVDTAGILHVLDEQGGELLRKNLNEFHKSQILVTDVDANSEVGPIFVSAAADGTVNVLSMMIEGNGASVVVTAAEVSNFNIRVVPKKEKSDGTSPPSTGLPRPTTMHIYNRGSQRGVGIYIGDSYCRFSIFQLNGTVVGRTAVTALPESFESERTGLVNTRDHYECGPGEERGVGHMARIGQVMALPVGKAIILFHIARLYVPPRVCHGSDEIITEAVFDLTSMTYLLASTSSGALLTFNTKTKDERGKETRCSLMRMVPGSAPSEDEAGWLVVPRKLASLKGYVLGVETVASSPDVDSCRLTVLNTSSIKQHREASLLVSEEVAAQCWGKSQSISMSPKNLRDPSARLVSEVLVSVAHSEVPQVVQDSSGGSSSDGHGEISVYLSLLQPVEPEDELAWLKWPMTIAGVLCFVLFKMFGTRKTPKPNTSGGTFSKYGRYNSRFGERDSNGGGAQGGSSDLKQLREKLSEIENSVNQMDSAGNGLLKKFVANRSRDNDY